MKRFNVLIVDDNQEFVNALKTLLEMFHSDKVDALYTTDNGNDAIEIVKTNQVDIIFMDFDMPGLNGAETTRLITEENRYVKVIAVSFHTDFKILEEMLQSGARKYISKEKISKELLKDCLTDDFL